MEAKIHRNRIDILGAKLSEEEWESLLDELKAEPVPGFTTPGRRLAVVIGPASRIDAIVYRTTPIPDSELVRILWRHGIPATTVLEKGV
jgi:hypothetical protein